MSVPQTIRELVERFERQRDAYRSPHYNETQLRREFLDPFFKVLGWDIDNEQGYAEAYKDVIHEDAIKVGEATKAPDYCFRIGGARKFFLEAKKPAVDIQHDVSPAFQLRRYGFTTKLPLNILTDFEEFAVYDCRFKPDQHDNASRGRILYIPYTEYAARWDKIAGIFSRGAFLKGAFDKFAESTKAKRGTADVDDEFLKTIEGWRADLARNLALRNPHLTQRELNFAVQRIIDRIIFLRICEGRGLEDYGRLQALTNGGRIYPRLAQQFEQADARYNSGLFHFQPEKGRHEAPDELTLGLDLDDKLLRDILESLYYPECPYVFSALPADILGQVYEQFLGKVIRLTEGHRAVVEEKPEVEKAGGVYYTPTYIVDYIVQNTVGKLLEEIAEKRSADFSPLQRAKLDAPAETPDASEGRELKRTEVRAPSAPDARRATALLNRLSKLRILDPACGSGSFLLGAYEHLLKWHLDFYAKNDPARWAKGNKPVLVQVSGGSWRLTIAERKRILLDNIYGVDIDAQAVETTKLSLLLKVLEGETQQSLQPVLRMFQERALPDLGDNIKCGNSLIGPDFYQQQQMNLLDEEERYRINVFDWSGKDGFPEIMKAGGFDAVIGNPPWISLSGKFGNEIHSKEEVAYLVAHFHGNTYMPNMYEYFVAQGLNLVAPDGRFSFIVPDRLGYNAQFVQLRGRILAEAKIASLVYKVPFPGITADTLVFVFQKGKPPADWSIAISEFDRKPTTRKQSELLENLSHAFECFENAEVMSLVTAVSSRPLVKPLGQVCESTSGFGGQSSLIHEFQTNCREISTMKGDSIGRYEFRKRYWFEFRRENITGRTTDTRKLGAIPKVLIRKTGDTIIATFDDSGIFPEQSLYFLFNNQSNLDCKYLLGLLNSSLLTAYYRAKLVTNKKSIAQVKKVDLDQMPIRGINFSNAADKSRHDQIVNLVEQMLELHQRLSAAKTPQEKTSFERQIAATDTQIDRLVYDLYDLTETQIKIVEGATNPKS